MTNTCAVIVTYNRRVLLERCVDAMLAQSLAPNRILIVDNASTDDTEAYVRAKMVGERLLDYHRLPTNSGGAGGFAEGLRRGRALGYEKMWIMDDDAVPHPDALEQLLRYSRDETQLYGSMAVSGAALSWTLTLIEKERERDIHVSDGIPAFAHVRFLPFLGLLVSSVVIDRIGLPDAGFFIAADDVEYSFRAQRAGIRVHVVAGSKIEHPAAPVYYAPVPGRTLTCVRMVPWKRYYDTRNRILIARRHLGLRLLTQTLPGTFIRWIACLTHEKQRVKQSWAFLAGTIDGILGLKGPRHTKWRITF